MKLDAPAAEETMERLAACDRVFLEKRVQVPDEVGAKLLAFPEFIVVVATTQLVLHHCERSARDLKQLVG